MINDPVMILEYIKKKETELLHIEADMKSVLPQLMATRNTAAKERTAEIYEGFVGMKTIREDLMKSLKPKDTFLVLGAPKIANEKWEGWFLEFHKKRIANKVNMQIIYNADAKPYASIRKKMSLTKVRFLPKNMVSPTWIDIFPEAVLIVAIVKEPIAFVIRDKSVSESFKNYFEMMWNISTE
jgi:hypothetical protein